MDIYKSIAQAVERRDTIHLIGIGGVSMKSLAKMLADNGADVQGSNKESSEATKELEEKGIKVFIGHNEKNIGGAALIIKTAAIHDDNPEIIKAKSMNIPIITRAEAWGALMREYTQRLCIAGTHGKTTTTGMAACAAIAAGINPTVMIGGDLPAIGGAFHHGDKQLFIAESCEYCDSYHAFSPTVSVILNIEADHLDFFGNLDNIIKSFREFALKTEPGGAVIINSDDAEEVKSVQGIGRKVITYGLSGNADVYPENLTDNNGYYAFDVMINGEKYAGIKLNVAGIHNVSNALACAAAFRFLGVDGEMFEHGIGTFTGTGRRFEKKGYAKTGALVIDDYAHHPSEIKATLSAAKEMNFKRIFCVFQPHTYSRTETLFDEFVSALSLADRPVLTEIYAAREINSSGISAKQISDKIPNAEFFESFEDICNLLEKNTNKDDLIITMGAGDVYKIADMLTGKE